MVKKSTKRKIKISYIAISLAIIILILVAVKFKVNNYSSGNAITGEVISLPIGIATGCAETDFGAEYSKVGTNYLYSISSTGNPMGISDFFIDRCVSTTEPGGTYESDYLREYLCVPIRNAQDYELRASIVKCNCRSSMCGRPLSEANSLRCEDSDEDPLIIPIPSFNSNVKGIMSYDVLNTETNKHEPFSFEERCIDEFYVEEAFCDPFNAGLPTVPKLGRPNTVAIKCGPGKMCQNGACVTPGKITTPPPTGPTIAVASTAMGGTFTSVSQASSYESQASRSSSFTSPVIEKTSSYSYIISGLSPATTYYTRVRACNPAGCGPWSTTKTAKTLIAPPSGAPAVPTRFMAKRISKDVARLTWYDVSGETDYQIFRATTQFGTYSRIQTIGANKVSYDNSGLSSTRSYYYKIRACKKTSTATLCGDYTLPVYVDLYY